MKTTKDIKMSVVSVEGTHSLALDNPESNCYRYKHLLPYFAQDNYPPLSPFEHVDPGFRALGCENPRAFLNNASKVTDLTPNLGTEVLGLNLTELDGAGKDQLALEVSEFSPNIVLTPSLFGSRTFAFKVARRGLF